MNKTNLSPTVCVFCAWTYVSVCVCVCTTREIYFQEAAYVFIGVGKLAIIGQDENLERQ